MQPREKSGPGSQRSRVRNKIRAAFLSPTCLCGDRVEASPPVRTKVDTFV